MKSQHLMFAVLTLGLGSASFTAHAQGQEAPQALVVDEYVQIEGPPSPEARPIARREAWAEWAWATKHCRESDRGSAYSACIKQAEHDRNSELAYANGGRRK